MKRNSTLPTVSATTTQLVLPEQLAQQAADAVRELLAEAAAAKIFEGIGAWGQANAGAGGWMGMVAGFAASAAYASAHP